MAIAVALVVLPFVPGVAGAGVDLAGRTLRSLDSVGVVLGLAQALPLLGRRRYPGMCLSVVGGAFALHQVLGYPTTVASLGLWVACYSYGAHGRRPVMAAGLAAVLYAALAIALRATGSPAGVVDFVTFAAAPIACGVFGA